MEEVGGGWRPYSRGWQALTPGPGVAAVLPTRVSSARQGGGGHNVLHCPSVTSDTARRHLCNPLGATARWGTRGRLFFLTSACSLFFPTSACSKARRTAERRRRRRGDGGFWGGVRRGVDGGGRRGPLEALGCGTDQRVDLELWIDGRRRRRRARRLDRRRYRIHRSIAGRRIWGRRRFLEQDKAVVVFLHRNRESRIPRESPAFLER